MSSATMSRDVNFHRPDLLQQDEIFQQTRQNNHPFRTELSVNRLHTPAQLGSLASHASCSPTQSNNVICAHRNCDTAYSVRRSPPMN